MLHFQSLTKIQRSQTSNIDQVTLVLTYISKGIRTIQNSIIRYQLNGLIPLELGYPKTTPEIVSETTAEFLFGPPNRQGKYLFVYIYQLSYKCTY